MNCAEENLKKLIGAYGKMAVALSGGLDSSVLLAFCARELGAQNCLAVTAKTPYMMLEELSDAARLCEKLGVEYAVIESEIPESIRKNPPDRCYLCKRELFESAKRAAHARGFEILADGTNADDTSDYRPGMRALRELGVKSPFLECGMGKGGIRKLAREMDMSVADKPSYACLLTRLEHGADADIETLRRVDMAETYIRHLGFKAVRVRVHGGLARIELEPSKIREFCVSGIMEAVSAELKKLGFKNVALDLDGYKRGAMNG